MKRVVIILCALIGASYSEAKWCHQNFTVSIETTKIMTRTKMVKTSFFSSAAKVETYKVVEFVPKIKQKRVCCEGYTIDIVRQFCIPTCPDGCPTLAECAEPNTCKCHPGYHLQDNLCRLDCGNCENGQCTDLGSCECNPKYVRIGDSCTPICRDKCTNGFCAGPDKCECNSGYQENPETNRCEPICTQTCGSNAYCSAPEVCSCKYGFFGNASDVCQPWCKSECKNGQCAGPNNCACHQGFVKVDGLCLPDCHSSCKFGDCLDEGVCQCWPDYVYNSSTGSCQEMLYKEGTAPPNERDPITPMATSQALREYESPVALCLNGCQNGRCIDGVCYCHEGYVKVDSKCFCYSCKPGDCIQEDLCHFLTKEAIPNTEPTLFSTSESSTSELSTDKSSTSESSTSISATNQIIYCDKGCVNSFCIAPNLCECYEGYMPQLSPLLAHICLPTCDGVDGEEGCLNGTCVAVNKCQCLEGFVHKPGNRFECIPDLTMTAAEKTPTPSWVMYILYVLLGLLLLMFVSVLGLYALRKMYQDSYNVDRVEKHRGTVRYTNDNHVYCVI